MKRTDTFGTLLSLSERQADDAAQRLRKASAEHEMASERLAMLEQVRAEYAARLEAGCKEGLSLAAFRNFNGFIAKIDQAIAGQKQILQDAAHISNRAQQHWVDQKRNCLTWSTLAARAEERAQQRAAKAEQKATDEFAQRAALAAHHR